MIVGGPREVKDNEFRVALTPEGARELSDAGHTVLLEDGAAEGSSLPRERYERAGAKFVASPDEVWAESDLILKVKEPVLEEFDRMREGVTKFGKDTGHDTLELGPAKADAAEQVKIIENLIAQRVDAICVVPFSPEALEPVLKKARDAGIVVISTEAKNQQNVD